jgi:hypothetical protein
MLSRAKHLYHNERDPSVAWERSLQADMPGDFTQALYLIGLNGQRNG